MKTKKIGSKKNRVCKLLPIIAILAVMYSAPSLLLANYGDVAVTINPTPVFLGNLVKITATGSNFADNLVYGEVDIRNGDDEKFSMMQR